MNEDLPPALAKMKRNPPSELGGATLFPTEKELAEDARKRPPDRFAYVNSLDRPFDFTPKVRRIEFGIDKYSKLFGAIIFKGTVCEAEAVQAAESYLSLPLTEGYFNKVKGPAEKWSESKSGLTRADCLGPRVYLEALDFDAKSGTLDLSCGS